MHRVGTLHAVRKPVVRKDVVSRLGQWGGSATDYGLPGLACAGDQAA